MRTAFIFLLLAIIFQTTVSSAAAYHWKFYTELKGQSVADGESKFVVGDWNCTVGEAKPDNFGNEMRRIGCSVGDGLQSYLLPICYKDKKTGKPRSEGGLMSLQQKKTGSIQVSLSCE